jgi:hydroxyacylglutathione hydrolase
VLNIKLPIYEYCNNDYNVVCIVTGGQWKQNTYIIIHKPSLLAIIIDPGDSASIIINYIKQRECKVYRILLTHAHFDHVGALMELYEYFNVVCELHDGDVKLLKQAPMYALRFSNKVVTPVTQFNTFNKLCFSTSEFSLRAIHTPGHTKGSVCYAFSDFVITGDTLLHSHVGRTDLPGSSPAELYGSIEFLLNELNDNLSIYSGHGKPWTIGEAKNWWRKIRELPPPHTAFTDLE